MIQGRVSNRRNIKDKPVKNQEHWKMPNWGRNEDELTTHMLCFVCLLAFFDRLVSCDFNYSLTTLRRFDKTAQEAA